MFLFRVAFLPLKIVLFVARTVGYSRVLVFGLGVVVGLLVAPTTGAELRRRLQAEVEARRAAGPQPSVAAEVLPTPVTPEV